MVSSSKLWTTSIREIIHNDKRTQNNTTRYTTSLSYLLSHAPSLDLRRTLIPQFKVGIAVIIALLVTTPLYIISAHGVKNWRPWAFAIAFDGSLILAALLPVSIGWIPNAFLVLLLACTSYVLPHQAHVYLTFERVGDLGTGDEDGDVTGSTAAAAVSEKKEIELSKLE